MRKVHQRLSVRAFDMTWILPKTVAALATLLKELGIPYPKYATAYNTDEAIEAAKEVGYPVLIRPSYVIGGQRMRIVLNDEELEKGILSLIKHLPGNKILIDHFPGSLPGSRN